MARPKRCRRIGSTPGSSYFKPRGIPLSALEEVVLSFDEFEAVRLADLEGLYQDQAAEKMGISRQTFGTDYRIGAPQGGGSTSPGQGIEDRRRGN